MRTREKERKEKKKTIENKQNSPHFITKLQQKHNKKCKKKIINNIDNSVEVDEREDEKLINKLLKRITDKSP